MSLFSRRTAALPTADTALKSTEEPVRIDGTHTVLGTRMRRPGRPALRSRCSGWGASGGSSGCSGGCPECTRRPRATPVATPRTQATSRCAAVAPATPRWCSSSSTRPRSATTGCCGPSGRTTTRPRGCGRATTAAASIDPRSTPHGRPGGGGGRQSGCLSGALQRARYGVITTEIGPLTSFYYAEDYTSSIWTRTLAVTAICAAQGLPVRSPGRPAWVSTLTDGG